VTVIVKGDKRAEAVILRAGRKAQDQSSSLESAGQAAGAISPGGWRTQTGELTGSLGEPRVEATGDRLVLWDTVPYSRFVFYGTSRQKAQPPRVQISVLAGAASRKVAHDLVSP
jgi:hypothetical protein